MNYKLRLMIYLLNKSIWYAGLVGFVYSLAMLVNRDSDLEYWVYSTIIFLAIMIIAVILYLVRKSKLPLPGKDYK
jgi:phosphotransferase system  glucose/maltose/N-acetylglucosamine-specific IIC component